MFTPRRPLSLHRVRRKAQYRDGARVFQDDGSLPQELPLHLRATDYQPVDIFDWQENVEGMVTAPALSRLLRKSESWVQVRWERGELPADEVVELGGRNRVPYFRLDRVGEIRERFGLTEVTEDSLYQDFLRFLTEMDMTASYKPVWLLALLECVDAQGRAPVAEVNRRFHWFYLDGAACGEPVESRSAKMARPEGLTPAEVRQVINQGPFDRFARLDFVGYARDRAYYQVHPAVWRGLRTPDGRAEAESLCRDGMKEYYASLARRLNRPQVS